MLAAADERAEVHPFSPQGSAIPGGPHRQTSI